MADLAALLRDFAQGASNSAAGTITGPVDLTAWLLRKAGLDIQNPIGGSDWAAQQGLMKQPENYWAGLLGEGVGGIAPIVAAAKAPQIAAGLVKGGENLRAPNTLHPQAGAFVYPQEAALATAQRNAAKPVSEGGLGLPSDNTPMQRAAAQGYVDLFHGTAHDIKQIDPAMRGATTGANSAKKAFWAVSDPTTARGYAENAATAAPVKRLLDDAAKFEKQGNWDAYEEALRKAEALDAFYYQNPLNGQNIMPLKVRANQGIRGAEVDAKGAEFVDMEGGMNAFLNRAIREKRDLAKIKNLADDVGMTGRPADHYAVFNPALVRSRFAAFDPARRNEADLLGGATPGLLGALGLGAGGLTYLLGNDR
jgi:hypothetical protein